MLRRFKDFEGFQPIPGVYSGYTINIHGEIKYRTGDIKIPIRVDEHGEWLSLRCTDGTAREFNRAVLVSMVARNISWPVTVCSKLTMYFLDDDCNNVHPSNTIIAPLPEEVEWKPGIRYIPGFSKYAIDAHGNLWDILNNVPLTWYKSTQGYIVLSKHPDVYRKNKFGGKLDIRQHRALLLAYTKYPKNVCLLDVNHINSIRSDNKFENLEWCTRKQNNLHGAEFGSRFTKPVITKNVLTGEEKRFFSINDAVRYFNLSITDIIRCCKTDGLKVFKPATLFKYADSTTPWPDLEYAKEKLASLKANYYYVEYNGVIKKYDSGMSVADVLKMKWRMVYKKLKHDNVFVYNGYKVWRSIDYRLCETI